MFSALVVDLVLIVHLAFIAFVVFGGFLVLRRPGLLWWHVAAVAWGSLVEFTGWNCPLTVVEYALRHAAGDAGYGGGFVAHYLLALIYPEGLTRTLQYALGAFVLAVNAAVYGLLWKRRRGPNARRPR